MKKNDLLRAFCFFVAIAGSLSLGIFYSQKSADAEQAAKHAAAEYVDALNTADLNEIMRLTKDLRYQTEKRKELAYQNMIDESILNSAALTSFYQTEDDRMIAKIRFDTKISGVHELDYPVIKENGTWKVLIERRSVQQK